MKDQDKLRIIKEELEKAFLEEARRTYSDKVVEIIQDPPHFGQLKNPNGMGVIRGDCGDTMKVYLQIKDDRIDEAAFETDGCGATVAAGSAACDLAGNKKIREAMKISPAIILDELDGLPEDHLHCAILAANTLQSALGSYLCLCLEQENNPSGRQEGRSEDI